ncbi:hypothetical protein NGB36_18150 [Streptomyces sp. RB6PN25]|uniref:FtsK domain-containing protein n=1 Tax=Streptomyces humicola TaxID=2953240 RepID=A0ABT1PXR2_9ACTN|nr:hypothetical protein [Streptomyces humicola]MCQ4082471.1 hypothetical protein [Streptomyces humicola]
MSEDFARSNSTPADVVDLDAYRHPTGPRVIQGTVLPKTHPEPPYAPELDDDPIGDAPLIPAWIRSKEGRRARAKYAWRITKRRARKSLRRQTTTHGTLPRIVRGTRRTHEWVRGTEGIRVTTAKDRAHHKAKTARAAERKARWTLMDRDLMAKRAEKAKVEADEAALEHHKLKKAAARATTLRAAAAYGPALAAETCGYVLEHGLGMAAATLLTVSVAAWRGRRLDEDEAAFYDDPERSILDPGMTPRAFGRMLRDALEEDLGINVADLHVIAHHWGFEAKVQLSKAKPADVTAKLDDLEALLIARPGSLLVQQSAKARPLFTLRALGENPWAGQKPIPYRAPKSVSCHDRADLGVELSQQPLLMNFLRTNAVFIGGPGSGKSNALLSVAEYLTACRDAVVWDIDLGSAGAGLDPIGDAIARRATNKVDARRLLEDALAISITRPKLFKQLSMGRNWEPSETHPALYLIIDEYPALVAAGLWPLVAEIIRTGRKSAVNLIMAAQGATKSFLGSADPGAVQNRVALPCRPQDVTQLFDGGAIGEGWAAHKLRPSEGKTLNDVSVAYVRGGDHVEPIPKRFNYLDDDSFEARGTERRQAGLVALDGNSLAIAEVDLSAELTGDVDRFEKRIQAVEEIEDADDAVELPPLIAAAIEVLQNAEETAMTPGDLLTALQAHNPAAFGDLNPVTLGRTLSSLGAGARKWGDARGVYLSDLLTAAATYRRATAQSA